MTPLPLYFLKANLALALCYIGYRLLFQQDTFFKLRRATLISLYLIAFLYQLPDLSSWLSTQASLSEVVTYYSTILPKENLVEAAQQLPAQVASTSWIVIGRQILLAIYLIGVFVLLFRCAAELVNVLHTRFTSKRITLDGIKVYLLTKPEVPYSFFNWIFVYPNQHTKDALDEILLHEATHARQLHSLDILLSEFVSIVCWMNPFVWLLKKEIGINHEYLADRQVLVAGYNKKAYQYHLIGMESPHKAAANLYNYFSVLPLKKRITMLNKKRTNRVRKIKYLALIPMAAGLLLINNIDAMARSVLTESIVPTSAPTAITATLPAEVEAPMPPDEDKPFTVVEIMPQYPGGLDALLEFLATQTKEEYPAEARAKGIKGRVSISFIVEKDGSLTNFKVRKSDAPELNDAALRIVKKMGKWTPAKQDGKLVRVRYSLPLSFK